MTDKLVSGQLKFCRSKLETFVTELSRKEKLFQDKITKMHKEHNEEIYRLEDQIQRLTEQIKDLESTIIERPSPPRFREDVGR